MTALPTSVSFTDSGVTEAQFKTAITNQREFLAGLLGTSGDVPDAITALGTLGSSTLTKSSAYTVVAADRGALIECTGTFTLSLTAAATLAEGFIFAVKNAGSGVITIDPNSTEQIDGATTKTIAPNESVIVFCNGTLFYSLGSSSYNGLTLQIYTSNGTFTPPASISKIFVYVSGGGGAGGSAQFSGSRGGRGGNGGKCYAYIDSLLSSYAITIGTGGTAVAGSNNAYNNSGTSSSFGSTITCTGGVGGQNKWDGTIGANGTTGTATLTTGTSLGLGSANVPSALNYGDGGAGSAGGTGTVTLGNSGVAGIVVVFY